MTMKTTALLLATLFSISAFAHEGHDKNPGTVAAPHGGVVQGTSQIYLELVTRKEGVVIYPFDHGMKPIPLKDVKLEGTMTLPRKTKAEAVKFSPEGDSFVATIDAKGAYRYTLNLSVVLGGKKEKLEFNVEPQ